MSRKRHDRSRDALGCAVAEALEPRKYLAIAFDGGRLAYDRDASAVVSSYALALLNKTDSRLDLAVNFTAGATHSASGNGNGTFTFINGKTNGTLTHLRTGDMDGDGHVDIYGARGSNNEIWAHLGSDAGEGVIGSAFRHYTYGSATNFDYTTADMNGDGLTDLIVTGSNGLVIQRRTDAGGYTQVYKASIGARPCVQAIDVNGDGRRDILVGISDSTGNALGVVLQNSDGTFQSFKRTVLSNRPLQIRTGHFNADSILDVVVLVESASTTAQDAVDVLIGQGSGTYTKVETQSVGDGRGIAVADFDLDGRADVAVSVNDANNPASFRVLRTNLNGTLDQFNAAPFNSAPGDQIDAGDFNGDGKPDVIVRESTTGKIKAYLNTTFKPAVLRGLLWNDANRNQVRDTGEAGLFTPTVYLDADKDGLFDTGEITARILSDGRWEMLVPGGTHQIRLRPDPGWIQTFPYTDPFASQTAAHTVSVSGGDLRTNLNFGTYDAGDIQGVVFNDYNANQSFDPVETGLSGFTVFLDNNSNGVRDAGEPITATDSAGRYKFNVSSTTSYNVRVLPQSSWTNTTPIVKPVNAGPTTPAIVNFGFTKPATISGVVYYDYAANGRLDESEDVGVGGLKVFLDTDNDGVHDSGEKSTTTSTSTDPAQKGRYKFTGLFPKTYVVRLVKPTGYQQISPAPAGAGSGGPYTTFAFGGLDTFYTDFGVIRPVKVTGRAFRDSNANGVIDSSESGLQFIPVFIDYNGNGVANINEPYGVTDANGVYTLTSTRQGTFNVRAIRPSGFSSTVPSSSSHSVTFTYGAATTTGRNFGLREGAFNTSPFQSPINISTGSNPTALAAGDFNGDGKQDFIVASNSSVSQVFLGQGNGLFTPGQQIVIGESTRYMIATDVSGDGKPDLIAANEAFDFGASVLISNGNGTFKNAVQYAVTSNTYGVAAADFNGDGKRDLAYVGTTDGRVAILINKGSGAFNAASFVNNTGSFGGRSIVSGDVNKDGKVDLVVANYANDSLSVLLGAGNGTFTKLATNVTGGINAPNFVRLTDLNKDGKLDLVVLNEGAEEIRVKLGNGNGTFATGMSYVTGPTPTQVAVLDIDRDGNLDLIASCRSDGTTDISGDVSIHRGRGDGTFVARQIRTAHTSPTAVAIADYNNDGKLDIVAANFFSDDVSLLFNGTPAAPGDIHGTVWADLDLDGVIDSGEPRLGGQTVFADQDNDGVIDAGERVLTTTPSGFYHFADIPPGTYRIRVVIPAHMVQTTPVQRAIHTIALSAGQNKGGVNFGLTPIAVSGAYVFDNRSAAATGSWTSASATGQYGGNHLHDGNASKGSKSIRFDLKLPNAGYYAVQVRWVASANRATNVPIDIKSATNTRTVSVNQRVNGGTWNTLGVYEFNPTGGSITIRTTGTNGYVVADAVQLIPVAPPPTSIKDNSDASGVSVTGSWFTSASQPGYTGPNFLHDGNPGTKGGRAVKYTPTLTTGGGLYEIFGRWTAAPDRASNARYDIVTAFGTVSVFANQRTNGGTWVSLGFFELNPFTASVTIRNDGANGLVVADAVRFVRVV